MPIETLDDLRGACTSVSVEVLYSASNEPQRTPKAKFDQYTLPEHFKCPDPECAGGGFSIFKEVAGLVEARQEALEGGTTAAYFLSHRTSVDCNGTKQREGNNWEKCPKVITLLIEAELVQ